MTTTLPRFLSANGHYYELRLNGAYKGMYKLYKRSVATSPIYSYEQLKEWHGKELTSAPYINNSVSEYVTL